MQKLKTETPSGTINGTNKQFKTSKIIGMIKSIIVDGVETKAFNYFGVQVDLDVAPITSIVISYFYRETIPLKGQGDVTLGDITIGCYRKLGRVNDDGTVPTNLSKIYPEDYIKSEIRKSYKRTLNKSPEKNRIQQYTVVTDGGYVVIGNNSENTITLEQSIENDIVGMFILDGGTKYEYYSISSGKYQVSGEDISKVGDRVVVGARIPYGVQKVSSVNINGVNIEYVDERDWNMDVNKYTIIADSQNNKYIFLPYVGETLTTVVKYIPELHGISDDEDVIDIPEEYIDVVIYDVVYRLLKEKEDDRWLSFKDELGDGRRQGMLYEYQMFIRSENKKNRNRIGFAKTI